MLFDNNDVDLDFALLNLAGLNTPNNMNSSKFDMSSMFNKNILPAKEGFLRGNMFKDEYKPYKNLTYINIRPKNEREAKLFNVMQYSFAINDLNLYLDLHPEDTTTLKLFQDMVKEEKEAKKEYMQSYGPLTVSKVKGDKFDWIDNPWTWENLGGNMYV